jgi:ribosome maturation factor RimP
LIERIKIIELAHQFLEGKSLFLTDVRVKPVNRISVIIDGDDLVGIDDCVALSRFVESNLDRETEDFELTVTSAGIDEPLKFTRQYKKNQGRTLAVELTDGQKHDGKLTEANDETITLEKVVIEKINNKNIKKNEIKTIAYSEIQKATVVISFK